jgi:hypothetical protein
VRAALVAGSRKTARLQSLRPERVPNERSFAKTDTIRVLRNAVPQLTARIEIRKPRRPDRRDPA